MSVIEPIAGPPRAAMTAEDLSVGYHHDLVVQALNVAIPAGQTTVIIGPNGCGKSTLLKALGRLLKPRAGRVLLDGTDIHSLDTRLVARRLGLLSQGPVAPGGLTVADLAARGRHPHQSWLRQWSPADASAVTGALEATGMADLADQPIDELSGGQRQRAWLAMVLAQQTELLLLDEPTTYLDMAHAVEVLDLVDRIKTEQGRTVVMVLHDLTMACRYADNLIVMVSGAIRAVGAPAEIVTAELVEEAFGIPAAVIPDPVAGRPLIIPIGTRRLGSVTSHEVLARPTGQ
ncbi:MAG: ABC transporter ATP-binding protein [Candidatus Nanopelagicales bacterium]